MTKAARQPSTYVLAGIVLAYAAILTIALSAILGAPPNGQVDPKGLVAPLRAGGARFVAQILTTITTITLVVFASTMVAQEFTRGTLRTLILHRATRSNIAAAKLITLGIVAIVAAICLMMLSIASAFIIGAFAHEGFLQPGPWAYLDMTWRFAADLGYWAAIAFATTLWTRSLGAGIGATLGSLIIGDVLVGVLSSLGTWGVWAGRILPNAGIRAIAIGTHNDLATWAWVIPSLLVYVGMTNWLAMRALRRMDVIAATK
jgi:ABC-2 type transport system permease protein